MIALLHASHQLQDRMEELETPQLPPGVIERRTVWSPRFLYSYFALYGDPRHTYTKTLLAAVPVPDPKHEREKTYVRHTGELPSPLDTRSQLIFLKSKMIDDPGAEQYRPQLLEVAPGHFVAEHDPVT